MLTCLAKGKNCDRISVKGSFHEFLHSTGLKKLFLQSMQSNRLGVHFLH